MDECLDCSDLGTGSIISGGTVSKGHGSFSVEDPGRERSRRRGEGVGGNTNNPEIGVLVTGAHRPEELLDAIDWVERVVSGANKIPRRLRTSSGAC